MPPAGQTINQPSTPNDARFKTYVERAGADIAGGMLGWRIWSMLAFNDIGRRYRRSRVGQFWFTISMLFLVLGLGFIYSHLFKTSLADYLPYLTVSIVLWGLLSGLIIESCAAFPEAEALIRQYNLPRSVWIFRVIGRVLLICAHNFVIIPLIFLVFQVKVSWTVVLFIPALMAVVTIALLGGYALALVCVRYRDVPQIVSSFMQVAFFATPVMFKSEQLTERGIGIMQWNPFACLLEVMREPLLGNVPSLWAVGVTLVLLFAGFLLLPFIGRYSPRTVYWL